MATLSKNSFQKQSTTPMQGDVEYLPLPKNPDEVKPIPTNGMGFNLDSKLILAGIVLFFLFGME